MANPMSDIALGSIVLVLAAVITLTVLPIADSAIDTYAAGPDGFPAGDPSDTGDNPSASNVALLDLFPLTVIASLVIGGVAFLVRGFRSVKA